jgi:hypothetical protein
MNDKDIVCIEYEKMQSMDYKNRKVYSDISSPTIDYLNQLYNIKMKNIELYGNTNVHMTTENDESDIIDLINEDEKPLNTKKKDNKSTLSNNEKSEKDEKKNNGNDTTMNNITNSFIGNDSNADITKSTIYQNRNVKRKAKDLK